MRTGPYRLVDRDGLESERGLKFDGAEGESTLMRKIVWCALLAGSLACGTKPGDLLDSGVVIPTNDAGMLILPNIPVPLPIDLTLLPNADGAKKLLVEASGARLEVDPSSRDAITALGECLDLISYCYEPSQRNLQSCVKSAKSCSTQQPWTESACCPAACKSAYDAKVASGRPMLEALEDVFFTAPDCFPGVKEAL